MLNILIIGLGGVGTIAAFVLEKSGQAKVTAVLRPNYATVDPKVSTSTPSITGSSKTGDQQIVRELQHLKHAIGTERRH
jgi:ketopantoate reductase